MHIPNFKKSLVKVQLRITKFVEAVSKKVEECTAQLQAKTAECQFQLQNTAEECKAQLHTKTEECKTQLQAKANEANEYKAELQCKACATVDRAVETLHTAATVAKLQEASLQRRGINRCRQIYSTIEAAIQDKSNKMNETRRKLHQTWANKHSFTFWFAPADGSHIAKKHIKKTSLKFAAVTFAAVFCSLLVTIGVLGYFAHVNEVQRQELAEFQKTRLAQEKTIKELQEMAEKNQKQLAYLSKLEDKVRTEMEKNGAELPPKQDVSSFAGTGGPNIAGASQTDVILLQEMNIKKEVAAKKTDLENLLNVIENENYRRAYTPSVWPTSGGYISSYFGGRRNPFDGYSSDWHSGIDIANNYGAPVYASASGYVNFSGWYGGYGRYVEINHDFGYKTAYAHMSSLAVSSGSYVEKGDIIGYVGSSGNSTGPHLHFEVWRYGQEINPLDLV